MKVRMPLFVIIVVGLFAAGCAARVTHTTAEPGATPTTMGDTLAANRHASEREANRLLSLARVPSGALTLSAPPAALDGPPMVSIVEYAAVTTRYWRVGLPYADAVAWVRANPPSGLAQFSSFMAGEGAHTSSGIGYSEPDTDAWTNAWLQIGVAPLSASTSAIAARAQVTWLDPSPRRDTRTGPRMSLLVERGCPGQDEGVVGVASTPTASTDRLVPTVDPTGGLLCRYDGLNGTRFALVEGVTLDGATATRIAQALRRVKLSHPVRTAARPCPFDDGRAMAIALSYPGQPDVAVWFAANGCPWVSNGTITADAGEFGTAIDAIVGPWK